MSQQYTWLHIGLGSFHRAHQAWYLNELIKAGNDSWAIAAGNIRNDSEHTAGAAGAKRRICAGNHQPMMSALMR